VTAGVSRLTTGNRLRISGPPAKAAA